MAALAWDRGPAGPIPPGSPRHLRPVPATTAGPLRAPARRPHPAAVYRRRRVAVAAAAVAVLTVVAVGLAVGRAPAALRDAPGGGTAPAPTVVVGPGETLWQVVVPHAPAGAHPMAYVVEVAAYNDIDPRAVPAGTVLRLPAVRP